MGIYLNPGNVMFRRSLNSAVYVDKTDLIRYTNRLINTENNLLCVSRPRRFGKSVTLQMLSAYYSKGCDSREMFAGLKLGNFGDAPDIVPSNAYEKEWTREKKAEMFEMGLNRYDTLYLDMQGIIGSTLMDSGVSHEILTFSRELLHMSPAEKELTPHPLLTAVQRRIIRDIRKNAEYAACIPEDESFLGNALRAVYEATGNQFVILIDEWDCVFRNHADNPFLQDKYVDFLRNLFKNAELLPAYALVYMTGILPIKRYGTQSALNNFKEFTMLNMSPLERFAGFTEEETAALYEKYGMDFMKAQEWYDGYRLGELVHIYNPNSVVQSVTRGNFENYWTATGTYESVRKVIDMNFDGLKEKVITLLGNERCKVNTSKFQNDMVTFESADDALTFLIHLGYLGYDGKTKEVYIPNKEIRDEFVNAISGNKWTCTFEAISNSEELLAATLAGDENRVADMVEAAHAGNTAILTYNNENSLSCVIQIAYYKAQDEYRIVREMPSGKGFCDIAFIPRRGVNKPALIVELKWNKDAQTALNQIREKHYSEQFQKYFGEVLLVGISYDKDSGEKMHTCRIERVEK